MSVAAPPAAEHPPGAPPATAATAGGRADVGVEASATGITAHWHELVTASLLGTDRREPPDPPPGPLADVVADACRDSPSGRMLAAVAACTVARRAGLRPRSPAPPLAGPPADERPLLPVPAARRWEHLVAEWPVLEDEWLLAVERHGWRLAPDVLVGLLGRHHRHPRRRDQARRIGGPLVDWLVEHQPGLAPPASWRSGAGTATSVTAGDVGLDGLPVLAVPPQLVGLLGSGADAVIAAVAGGLAERTYAVSHRAVLVNFVARCRRDVLTPLAGALADVAELGGLARSLAAEATTRHEMLVELEQPR